MAQLRNMLDTDQVAELWNLKDRLKLLGEDITGMYKGRFEEYMQAKSDVMYRELTSRGVEHKAALHAVSAELAKDMQVWKASRPRRKQ